MKKLQRRMDPVVREIRATRERLLAEAGGSLKKLVLDLREWERNQPGMVRPLRLRGRRSGVGANYRASGNQANP